MGIRHNCSWLFAFLRQLLDGAVKVGLEEAVLHDAVFLKLTFRERFGDLRGDFATDEAARQRFVAYIHGQVRELLTNYGKIDILWYDVAWPLDAKGWESEKMNDMVFQLQPAIIVNNRNKLDGDFATPEQRIVAEKRAWESCMTMNDSWGYQKADDDWKTPKTIVKNLIACARDTGNYLLNIGPKPDGSI